MYSQIERYTIEYERDAEGNKIPDRLSGYNLTEQTIQARREYRQAIMKGREPMDDLPDYLRANPRSPYLQPPKLRYGLAFTTEQLLDCAERYDLPLEELPIERHALHVCDALCEVDSLLSGACKMILRITKPMDLDNEWMVPLYDNYNWWSERLVPEEEEEVVTLIRRALKIDMPLRWYYDASPSS
ncbi:hypothetical protein EWM64_g5511 [Hericium alpestre]|uniref:Uncharacterized protein n=1 Tax=Hericium alpestre TaxID=135208 RepID=A0A4Y9ZWH0_9AGAM|nr:hypothetical protein EWM64_g5511 [Hericium alpestre]